MIIGRVPSVIELFVKTEVGSRRLVGTCVQNELIRLCRLCGCCLAGARGLQGLVHDLLGLSHNRGEMCRILEALGVDLVDVLRARGTGREPTTVGDNLEAADRCIVPRGRRELLPDWFASQLRGLDRVRREFAEPRLLIRRCCGINAACSKKRRSRLRVPGSVLRDPSPFAP